MGSDGDIARYYDRNTPRFLLVGGGRSTHSIHRQLWGPGVQTVAEASNYVNVRIAEEIRALARGEPLSVIDMGCGVGGTLLYLAGIFPRSRFLGVTISGRQHRIAVKLATRRGIEGRCRFVQDDFQDIESGDPADVIVAIESFVHSESSERFFSAAARCLGEGGHLILVDDFVAEAEARLSATAARRITDLRSGWRLPSLCTVEDCVAAARSRDLALVKEADLSALVRLGRPRDRVIGTLSPLFKRLNLVDVPFFGNMIGGNALQIGLRKRFLQYRLLVLEKGVA